MRSQVKPKNTGGYRGRTHQTNKEFGSRHVSESSTSRFKSPSPRPNFRAGHRSYHYLPGKRHPCQLEEADRILEIQHLMEPHPLVLVDGELDVAKPHTVLLKSLFITVLCQFMMFAPMMKAATAHELIYYSFFVSHVNVNCLDASSKWLFDSGATHIIL